MATGSGARLSKLVTSLRSESEASRDLEPARVPVGSHGQKDSGESEEEDEEDVALGLSEDEEEL